MQTFKKALLLWAASSVGQGGMSNRNRPVDLGHPPSCGAHELCWHFEGHFNLALFPCWCHVPVKTTYVKSEVALKISPHPHNFVFWYDPSVFFLSLKVFSFLRWFLWGAHLPLWERVPGGIPMVATLPEAPSFTEMVWMAESEPWAWIGRGALLVLSVILSGCLFNICSFRGFSLSCSLKVFWMSG